MILNSKHPIKTTGTLSDAYTFVAEGGVKIVRAASNCGSYYLTVVCGMIILDKYYSLLLIGITVKGFSISFLSIDILNLTSRNSFMA